jgi:hypothetical protein
MRELIEGSAPRRSLVLVLSCRANLGLAVLLAVPSP